MSNMNYRAIALRSLKEFSDEFPDYTLGQILYSVLRQDDNASPENIKFLRNLNDEQIYTMIDKAKEVEAE